MLKQTTTNTFGDDLIDFAEEEEKLKQVKSLPSNKNELKKNPKSKKVKFNNLSKYIITNLSLLDEEWQNISYEIAREESSEDGDMNVIEQLEDRMLEINGAVDILLEQGIYFGIAKDYLLKYIPNINEEGLVLEKDV